MFVLLVSAAGASGLFCALSFSLCVGEGLHSGVCSKRMCLRFPLYATILEHKLNSLFVQAVVRYSASIKCG